MFGRKYAHEITSQDGNVFAPLAQGRHEEGDDVQAIEQILSETAACNFVLQILVCCGDHANIDAYGGRSADRLETLFLDGAQDLGLSLERHVPDLVQKERSAVGQFELAFLGIACAGERAFCMSEQFALNEFFRNRCAIHFDERLVRSAAHEMDIPC